MATQTIRSGKRTRKRFRRTIGLVPTIFTVGNIFFGFYAIVSVLNSHFDQAARLIGFAVICDMFDGRLARLTKTTSEMGLQLDSLADIISFCLAPAILINFWAFPQIAPFGWITSFIFLICGAIRLARFNVMAPDHKSFIGLPTPAAGGMIAALVHFMKQPESGQAIVFPLVVMVYALSFLMISTVKYPGFKDLQPARGKSPIHVLFLAVIVAGIYFYSEILLIIFAGAFAVSGLAIKFSSLVRRRFGKNIEVIRPLGKP